MAKRFVAAVTALVATLVLAAPAGAFGPPQTIKIFPNCGPGSYYKLVTVTGRETPLSPMDGTLKLAIQIYDPDAEIQPPALIVPFYTYGDSYDATFYLWVYPVPGIHIGAGATPPHPYEISPHGTLTYVIVQASPAAPPHAQGIWVPSESGCNKP